MARWDGRPGGVENALQADLADVQRRLVGFRFDPLELCCTGPAVESARASVRSQHLFGLLTVLAHRRQLLLSRWDVPAPVAREEREAARLQERADRRLRQVAALHAAVVVELRWGTPVKRNPALESLDGSVVVARHPPPEWFDNHDVWVPTKGPLEIQRIQAWVILDSSTDRGHLHGIRGRRSGGLARPARAPRRSV